MTTKKATRKTTKTTAPKKRLPALAAAYLAVDTALDLAEETAEDIVGYMVEDGTITADRADAVLALVQARFDDIESVLEASAEPPYCQCAQCLHREQTAKPRKTSARRAYA